MPTTQRPGTSYYLATLWTYGRLEIAFEQLRTQPPFDEVERRIQILTQLNQIPGIALPDDSYSRRPSIHLHALLADEKTMPGLLNLWARSPTTSADRRADAENFLRVPSGHYGVP
jgi:hypothetical protein